MHGGGYAWLPPHETEKPCEAADLSQNSLAMIDPVLPILHELGYTRGNYLRLEKQVEESTKDVGGYEAIHDDGRRFMTVAFVHTKTAHTDDTVTEIAGYLVLRDQTLIEVEPNKSYLDTVVRSKKIILKNADAPNVDMHLSEQLSKARMQVRRFASLEELRSTRQGITMKIWEERIQRGLFRKVPKDEEGELIKKMEARATSLQVVR